MITRLAEGTGEVVLSKLKMPFAEAKSCRLTLTPTQPAATLALTIPIPNPYT